MLVGFFVEEGGGEELFGVEGGGEEGEDGLVGRGGWGGEEGRVEVVGLEEGVAEGFLLFGEDGGALFEEGEEETATHGG